MGRSYRIYCMSLVERLGYKTLNELYTSMDNNEIMEWMAYDRTQNSEWADKIKKEISLENQKNQSLEEEAERIKAMFMALGGDKK